MGFELDRLKVRVQNMVSRAVLKLVDDAKKFQLMQIGALPGETRDDLEHIGTYGFTSNPKPGAEAVILSVGGRREHAVVIACDDRRYRLRNLASGEVALYTDEGDKMVFKRGGTIEVTAKTVFKIIGKLEVTDDVTFSKKLAVTQDVTMAAKLDVTGKGTFSGAVDVGTTLTASTDVVGGGKHLATHTHSASGSTAVGGGPVTFVPAGTTGAPS